ncbi:MAG: AMP-binding protein [Rhodobacteraceae bacterium]|nr:AMP-binding protein [Paracoccaceae bacterium]
MASLLQHFAAAVEKHPDRAAIVDGKGRQTSFAQLQARATGLASYWQSKGITKGDRVLLAMPLDADLYASLAALWSLGATVVLPEPAMGLAGLRHAAKTTRPRAFCASGYYIFLKYLVPELRGMTLLRLGDGVDNFTGVDPADSDIALISFTSGTTGKPKAIPRSHSFLMAQFEAIAPLLHSDAAQRDLVAFPVFTLINIASGQTSVLPNWKMSKLDKLAPAKLSRWIKAQNISRALLPPALCAKLTQASIPKNLHTIFTGGGPVFPDIMQKLQRNDWLRVVCIYGSTEAEPIAHLDASDISPADDHDMAAGRGLLVGRPVEHIALRIRDSEIQVAGAHVNPGYLDPAHDAENKIVERDRIWHRTGDAGVFDDQGRLWLWGRVGSEIDTAGAPLYPFSIEVAARYWPGVEQSALMGVDQRAILVVQGDVAYKSQWLKAAQPFGVGRIKTIDKIPMDARHRSKIDRSKLMDLLRLSVVI